MTGQHPVPRRIPPATPAGAGNWTARFRRHGHQVTVPAWHRDAGGELLVLLHGLGCAKDAFAGAFTSESLRRYSLCALDLPGHGGYGHGAPASLCTVAAYADVTRLAVAQLAARHGQPYERVHVAGHSMGGAVAVLLASRWPEATCVSIDGNLTAEDCGLASRAIAAQALRHYAAAGHARLIEGLRAAGQPDVTTWAAWLARADPAAVHAAARSLASCSRAGVLLRRFNDLPRKAFLYGDKEDKQHLAGRLRHAAVSVIPGSGHFPMLSNPDGLYQVLASALNGFSGPAPAAGPLSATARLQGELRPSQVPPAEERRAHPAGARAAEGSPAAPPPSLHGVTATAAETSPGNRLTRTREKEAT